MELERKAVMVDTDFHRHLKIEAAKRGVSIIELLKRAMKEYLRKERAA